MKGGEEEGGGGGAITFLKSLFTTADRNVSRGKMCCNCLTILQMNIFNRQENIELELGCLLLRILWSWCEVTVGSAIACPLHVWRSCHHHTPWILSLWNDNNDPKLKLNYSVKWKKLTMQTDCKPSNRLQGRPQQYNKPQRWSTTNLPCVASLLASWESLWSCFPSLNFCKPRDEMQLRHLLLKWAKLYMRACVH